MEQPTMPRPRSPRRAYILMAGLAILFVGASTVFKPFQSSASDPAQGPEHDRDSLGRVLARELELQVFSTGRGVRYRVTDPEGRILADDLEAGDVYRQFPDLAPADLHAGPDDHDMMLIEPDR